MQDTPPYFPISRYFEQRIGEKVAKISVSVAEACPNRPIDGTGKPCIFCDEWGSAAYHREIQRPLLEQIRHNKTLVTRRLKRSKFLVYFQSYTNTLDKVEILRERFNTALSEPYVAGIVIGTRPDCIPERLFSLIDELNKSCYVMIELGVQSFFDEQLKFLRRGHSVKDNIAAIKKLQNHTQADIGLHLIFGLPHETEDSIIQTAKLINTLSISNVKLHNLHVLRNTHLEKLYLANQFEPDSLEVYADKVILFLRHLSPQIAIQRLTALANRWDELVAPTWTREKMRPIMFIEDRMKDQGFRQGDYYSP